MISTVSVAYIHGASIENYIRAAGGTTRLADVDRAYVTHPSGKLETVVSQRFRPDVRPRPGAGSTVHVPQREETEKRDLGATFATVGQVLGALVALVAIARR